MPREKFYQYIVDSIKRKTKKRNIDNISRTQSYASFYEKHPEIKWSFLASMVSRNAGWSMTDLAGIWYQKALASDIRESLFLTYEKANWLIFSDAYPQLLIYELSKKYRKPLFFLLKHFNVSKFMIEEWNRYFVEKNHEHLLMALIINEQNVIQKPVLEQKEFVKNIFHTFPYRFQDFFHFSTVLFPTLDGNLYGCSVVKFRDLKKRIYLGKCLASILFHPLYYERFFQFSKLVTHTGSRYDYEKFFPNTLNRDTPYLRTTYSIISHDIDERKEDWFHNQSLTKLFKPIKRPKHLELTNWYMRKRQQLRMICMLEEYLKIHKETST